jgi:ParB family chromosome partitioning protein
MKDLGLQTLPVAAIDFGDRLRSISEDHAQMLATNIAEVGRLRSPIEVRTLKGRKDRGYTLIAGGHRLRAAQILGWSDIPAFVFEGSDDDARLAEIDENLVRHDLNPLDRAVFLAERKAVYERLHPETKHGAQGGRGGQTNESDTMSFSKDTAERCGWTPRTIERAVAIASGLQLDVRARIAGTWLAHKQSELLALIKLSRSEQHAVLDLLLAEEAEVKSVQAARRIVRDEHTPDLAPTEAGFQKLLAAWGRADKAARRQFVRHLRETGALEEALADSGAREAA